MEKKLKKSAVLLLFETDIFLITGSLNKLLPFEPAKLVIVSFTYAAKSRTFFNILNDETVSVVFVVGLVTFSVPTNTRSGILLPLKSPKLGLKVV